MKAFHGNKKIKEKYLKRVLAHQKADKIIQGIYWDGKKGCSVGCTLENNNNNNNIHSLYEKELGIPEELSRLNDQLFELLEIKEAKSFPYKFLNSINVGADLSLVPVKFKLFVNKENLALQNNQSRQFPQLKKTYDKVIPAIENVIELLTNKMKNKSTAESAESAESAAWLAGSAAESAGSAWSAARSAARSAAWSAAWSAAESAESAAWSAGSAAESAGSAAESAGSARSAAGSAASLKMSKELLRLLKEAKVK